MSVPWYRCDYVLYVTLMVVLLCLIRSQSPTVSSAVSSLPTTATNPLRYITRPAPDSPVGV